MSKVEQSGKRPKTGGRVKGTPNKVTGELKEMILTALDEAGGVDYLVACALMEPVAFLSLVGKVLPLQVTGDGGGPLQFQKIERVVIAPASQPLARAK